MAYLELATSNRPIRWDIQAHRKDIQTTSKNPYESADSDGSLLDRTSYNCPTPLMPDRHPDFKEIHGVPISNEFPLSMLKKESEIQAGFRKESNNGKPFVFRDSPFSQAGSSGCDRLLSLFESKLPLNHLSRLQSVSKSDPAGRRTSSSWQ